MPVKLPANNCFQPMLKDAVVANTEEPAKRAFSDNGEELFDMEQVFDDDLVYISTGSEFIVRKCGGTGGGE